MVEEKFLTGLRTNAPYHLGNYVGALLPLLNLIDNLREHQRIYLFAPDLHSFITPVDYQSLYNQTLENLQLFVAAGIPLDHPSIYLYRQSYIPAHSELTWILSNFAGFGDLSRMIEFKEKAQRLGEDHVNAGLFFYPVLMAADILLYDARWVPTGDDQRQHLEFCRRLGKSFNTRFKTDVFKVPAAFNQQQAMTNRLEAPRIRSLKDPGKKMSKSVEDPAGTIMLSDDATSIANKVKAATTDNYGKINFDWQNQPGITNLLVILAALQNCSQEEVNQQWCGQSNYVELKEAVSHLLQKHLGSLQQRLDKVNPRMVEDRLIECEKRLNVVANHKLRQVQELVGLRSGDR